MANKKKNPPIKAGDVLELGDKVVQVTEVGAEHFDAVELLADHEATGAPCRYTDSDGRVHGGIVSGAYSDGTFAVAVFDAVERCTRHVGPVAFGNGPGTVATG